MHAVDDIGMAIANVYAKSLFALAAEKGQETDMLEEFGGLIDYINGTPEFERFLTSATVDDDARRQTLDTALRDRASDLLLDFLQVVNQKARLELLEQIFTQYKLAHEATRTQIEVTVTSATPLTPDSRSRLLEALQRHTGKEPIVTERVDPSVIGGLVIHIDDEKIDFCVSTRLRHYRETFMARASHEIHSGRDYFVDVTE
jgi:F-type H+-transporting ATPase subunit delta